MPLKLFRTAKKLKDAKMLKVKPLSERKLLGGGKTEQIMKGLQDVKKLRIQVEQAANKNRMKYEGFEGGKRRPLKSSAKDDIKIAQDARKRRSKTRKEQAGAVAVGGASIAAVGALGKKYEEKKKAKKTEGMEKRVGKKDGGSIQIKGWGKARH